MTAAVPGDLLHCGLLLSFSFNCFVRLSIVIPSLDKKAFMSNFWIRVFEPRHWNSS
uniref:Uncharacterized protein n=1 Tax=Rhizophora mucronata TaxID=61149 RepID=A0A2P2Q3X2_RHIMU